MDLAQRIVSLFVFITRQTNVCVVLHELPDEPVPGAVLVPGAPVSVGRGDHLVGEVHLPLEGEQDVHADPAVGPVGPEHRHRGVVGGTQHQRDACQSEVDTK